MTNVGALNAGGRLTASEARGIAPLAAYKGSDQSVTSSTTLVNDSALVLALSANATYLVQALIFYTAGTTGDFKYNFSSPSGATSPGVAYIGQNTSVSGVQQGTVILGGPGAFGGNGTSAVEALELKFTIATSSAGNLTFQFAQNATDATATTCKAGSSLVAWQLQ